MAAIQARQKSFAKRIGSEAATRGYAPVVAPADDYAFGVPVDIPFVVGTASYEGLPPNNARRFVAWAESLPPDTLEGRPFAVFGCGNRHWVQTWQAVPKRLEAALAKAGALPVVECGEADAGGDVLASFDAWSAGLWGLLRPPLEGGSTRNTEVRGKGARQTCARRRRRASTRTTAWPDADHQSAAARFVAGFQRRYPMPLHAPSPLSRRQTIHIPNPHSTKVL
ncbi:flavodoxin domain-containing protein [Sinorhizobium prairiense]|uniref:flavodoxin domain-containing protein n=1 Tax=Sinorhizobium sp. M103 TaxID=2976821 RepID=UPI0035C89897